VRTTGSLETILTPLNQRLSVLPVPIASFGSRANAGPPEYCCCPVIRLNLQQGYGGSECNCRSNGKRLNLKHVSSCQTDEISTMVKNWTAAALRNAR
jgi:hypothetical protein